jgi:hypothetical protein
VIIAISQLPEFAVGNLHTSPLLIHAHPCSCRESDPVKFAKHHGIGGEGFTVLELPIDKFAADMLGTSSLVFLGRDRGKGLSMAVGHSRLFGNSIVCRKHNGVYCGIKDCEFYREIINYYLAMSWASQGDENAAPEPVNLQPDAIFSDMIQNAFKNGMD